MRVHTSISLRQARADLTWLVREVERHERSFVVTVHGRGAAAVVPLSLLELSDAKSLKRARKIAALARQLSALLPGSARAQKKAR